MTISNQVKNNLQILEFIKQTEVVLSALSFTDHGLRHANLVAKRAKEVAQKIGLKEREIELAEIAGFCHDMGNFISRKYHNYFASLLFHQVFKDEMDHQDIVIIMQAISNHDKKKEDIAFVSPVSAVAILADKSDVHRSRVTTKTIKEVKEDIHDRVNYATRSSELKIDKKRITLTLKIDSNFIPIMEYFEIFTERMVFSRKAAEYLGYDFGLVINKFRLL